MTGADDRTFGEAAAWHIASGRDDMDWDSFTTWLQADPGHRRAYEEIALADAALDDHRVEMAMLAESVDADRARKWPLWLGGALAASLAALLISPQLTSPAMRTFVSEGQPRTIAMEDGSQVVLGPHSKLTIAGRKSEQLSLQGGAYFAIRHNPNRALSVSAGGLEIDDIGTRFDLQANGDAVRVEVSDGKVEVRGEALDVPVQLAKGQRLLFDPAHEVATVARVSAEDVGEWREGRLSYDGAPLSLVVADLSRYAGISVSVPSPLATRRFSGALSIQDGDSAVRDLALLMGLDLSRDHGAYRLSERR